MLALSLLFLLISLLTTTTFLSPIVANPEVRALMELKVSLDPDGLFLSSWKNSGDPCKGDFEGVACNEHGKVVNISLQGKGLYGSVSPAVASLSSLSGLFLHYNALGGEIPKEMANLTELSDLYLNVNNITGSIPPEMGNMASLQVMQLCCNKLTGSIPNQLGLLKNLTVLSLQSNQLRGAIPASLGDLPRLRRLDLSFNALFGSLPVKLSRLTELLFLDVRNNSLSGNVPSDLQRLEGGFLYVNNSGLCGIGFISLRTCTSADAADLINPNRPKPFGTDGSTTLPQRSIPQSANVKDHCTSFNCADASRPSPLPLVIGSTVAVLGAVISTLLAIVWYRRRKQKIGSTMEILDGRLSTDQPKGMHRKHGSPLISLEYSSGWNPLAEDRNGVGFSEEVSQSLRFNLEEIEFATQYFSDLNLLGRSNFAATYRGILRDGSVVAVKSINKISCKTEESKFVKGLKLLASLRHDNLVGLRGFCCSRGRGECFLVYDFIANGRLSRFLDVKKGDKNSVVLDWPTRVAIVKGVARGLDYLHAAKQSKPTLLHQNLSAEKILIDHHFKPLLSGSGVHKLLADDVIFSALKGSAAMGYLAPEYTTTGRFSDKSDVYAFGVVVFQVLTGKRRATHMRIAAESGKLDDLIDENLQGNFNKSEAARLASVAVACTSELPAQRPTMDVVIKEITSTRA